MANQHTQHNFCSPSSTKTNLVTGLGKTDDFVLASAVLTSPFPSGYTDSTLPSGQELLGALTSTMRTTSPTCRLRCGHNHFWRSWSKGKYSRTHLFQKRSAKYCTCLHRRRRRLSSLVKIPGGRHCWSLSSNKWFGARQFKSFGSLEVLVKGRLLMIDSTSAKRVVRLSSVNTCSFINPHNTRRVDRISRSHEPPWCDAPGALKIHVITFWSRKDSTWELFHCCRACFSSRSAPTRFVPLSDLMTWTCPLRAMKRVKVLMKASESRDTDISKCTARVTKHVSNAPYRFIWLRPCFTRKGPK